MSEIHELSYTELKQVSSPSDFIFRTTSELEPLEGIIGQERGEQAFDFGLEVGMKGYNIYMAGPSGTGKTTYAKKKALEKAASEPVPEDWCYVYNFSDPKAPSAISFPAGHGKKFVKDMDALVTKCRSGLSKAFSSSKYAAEKGKIARDAGKKEDELLAVINETAGNYGFLAAFTDDGLTFNPVIEGTLLNEEDFAQLTDEMRDQIEKSALTVQEKCAHTLRELSSLQKEAEDAKDKLDQDTGEASLKRSFQAIQKKYQDSEDVQNFLSAVLGDMLENLEILLEDEDEKPEEGLAELLSARTRLSADELTARYKANLVIDNSRTKGAPVIVSYNPSVPNLTGEVEAAVSGTAPGADFTRIKGGLLHQARGGYLILQVYDVLTSPQAWETIRRTIKTGEISIEPVRDGQPAAAPYLKPQPIPARIKFIMIGSDYHYALLRASDEEFDKFFKIRADFDSEMPRTQENVLKMARFIKRFSESENTPPFDASAVCAVIEHSSRCAERQDKLSTMFNHVEEVLCESATWARLGGASVITAEHIKKAVLEKELRLRQYEEKLSEMYDDNVIMIATDGAEIGQINGLAVLDSGDYEFGIPSRITATAYTGKSGIVNIEKEAQMSGQTHDKGVQIISGYLGQTYAQKFPLSLSCRICFEQNYSGIDGDSASSTELYCILSSLSGLPIRQDLAVTGSVNQKGQIQAIGGATYKIEGFFNLCKKRGLTGKQGVIIPESNIRDLVLKDEVVEAVKEGMFHIYPISNIDQGLELLLGCPAGKPDENGNYPEDTVHGKVYAKLKAYSEAAGNS
ncbi:MAG: AAA family ATPase [Lachnospiraceae bacterium]|nr:AAA family ATPase [Lachnospiraceae bacterium]